MKKRTLEIFRFLRLTDESNRLSLTNIALVVAVVYLARRPEVKIEDLMAFIAALGAYQFKRWAQPETAAVDESAELKKAIADLQTKVTAMQIFKK